ncbi:MAG: glycosyltransferase family 87 protein [Terriglobales bacterium]
MNPNSSGKSSRLILAASLLACFGVWHWAESILVPANTIAAQSKGVPIGNNSDLYPRWLGARELLLHGRDPYSAGVTRDIQKGFYGRTLDSGNPSHPIDQAAFAYPLYVIFLLAPTVTLPFALVAEVFRWFLLFAIAATVPLWSNAVGLRLKPWQLAAAMLLAVSSYAAVLEFHMQNLAALVAVLLALAASSLVRGWLVLSGFLLALATIKPQLSGLFVVWFVIWAMGRWTERKRMVWSFMATMLALIFGATALSPHWLREFIAAVHAYGRYATDPSILDIFFPSLLPWVVAAGLVSALLGLGWKWRKCTAGSTEFGWALAWAAIVTLTIIPVSAYNQVLLIPPFLVLFAQHEAIACMGLMPRALAKAAFASQGWQWVTAVIISLGSFLISGERMRSAAQVPVYTLLAVPPLTLLAVVFATLSRPRRS